MRYCVVCAIILITGRQYIVMSNVLTVFSLALHSAFTFAFVRLLFNHFFIFYQGIQFKWQHDYTVIDDDCSARCYCLWACFSKPRESSNYK